MNQTVKLAEYLFARLRQLGIRSLHGVPGDYNLTLLDFVQSAGLTWVGNTNELNAGYAADGYARIKGVGALITTFGVGELSAINAIAGAFVERAAVVHIVGTPTRESQDSREFLHHTFDDGEYTHSFQMYAHISAAQTNLNDPRTAPDEIDYVLKKCVRHSRPVYIQIPTDMTSMPVSARNLNMPVLESQPLPTHSEDTGIKKVMDRIYKAKKPIILVDGESRALDIIEQVQSFVKTSRWPTWTTTFGKSLVDETLPNVHGVYQGSFGKSQTAALFGASDLILWFGPHPSATNTFSFSSIPAGDVTVSFCDGRMVICGHPHGDVHQKSLLSRLLVELDWSRVCSHSITIDPFDQSLSLLDDFVGHEAVTQDGFWSVFAQFLRPGDIILGETGTAGYGCRGLVLPPNTRLFTPVTWLSIGYMLPAAQGAALAQRELLLSSSYHNFKSARTILLIGDGSFQMTAQDISTMIRRDLNVVVFVINNGGYTIERCINGVNQAYNDIAPWRYLLAPRFFGGSEEAFTVSVSTWDDLQQVFHDEKFHQSDGFKMVEVIMGREDVPQGPLSHMLKKQKQALKE